METNETIIGKLNDLIQLDIDAIHAYDQALENIDHTEIRQALEGFRNDHRRHVDNLSAEVRQLGGTPTEFSRDFKGFLLEGFTAVRSATGTEGALKAMKSNEKMTNQKYENALSMELPEDIRRVVQQNRQDEARHLEYIERALEEQVWTRAA